MTHGATEPLFLNYGVYGRRSIQRQWWINVLLNQSLMSSTVTPD
jgi:hypothetical protein